MNTLQRFLLAGLSTVALASTSFGARFYAQPSIAIAEISGFESAAGPSLALGVLFDGKHALEIEGGRFDMEASYDSGAELRFIPVTLNYRYEFPIAKNFSGSLGVALGIVREEADFSAIYYDPYSSSTPYSVHYQRTDEAFAAGFSGGVSYRWNDHVATTFGVKALRTGRSDAFVRTTCMTVQLGLNIRL